MNRKSQITHAYKKQELLECCFALLVERGLENTGMRDFCQACGLAANNSLYYYFESKERLVVEAIVLGIEKIEKGFLQAASSVDFLVFLEDLPRLVSLYEQDAALVYQVLTSPRYRRYFVSYRREFNIKYEQYLLQISQQYGCSCEALRPLYYLLMTVVSHRMMFGENDLWRVQMAYLQEQIRRLLLGEAERKTTSC